MAVKYIDIAQNASTKASLTTLTQLNDGQVVHLLGYYAAGDGGGQSLVYNLTGRTGITVDSGFYFTGPGSDDYFEAVNKKVANVLQWGAKGDGSTDDTTRIQAAIDIAVPVYFPKGTYVITDALVLNTVGQQVYGNGQLSQIKQTTAEKNCIEVEVNEIEIFGLHGIGEATAPVDMSKCNFIIALGAAPANAARIFGLNVHDCSAEGFGSASVQLRGCEDVRISNNFFYGASANSDNSGGDIVTWGNCTRITITGNVCVSDVSQNIFVGALAGDKDITITGNVCDTQDETNNFAQVTSPTNKRHGIVAGYAGISNVTVSNNIIRNTNWTGIYGNTTGAVISNIVVSGNALANNGVTNNTLSGGIFFTSEVENLTIANNFIEGFAGSTWAAIRVDPAVGGTSEGVKITGNTIDGSSGKGISIGNKCQNVFIKNNHIQDTTSNAINIIAASGLSVGGVIADNVIRLSGVKHGIYVDNQTANAKLIVRNNSIINTDSTGGAAATCCGVYFRFHNFAIRENHIKGFFTGVYIEQNADGRMAEYDQLERNHLEDLTTGFVLRSTTGASRTWAIDTLYTNVTGEFSGGGSYSRSWNAQYQNGVLSTHLAAAPTDGLGAVGDRVYNTAPTAAGTLGWVCTTAGEPGTWKTFGAITA